MIILAWCRLWQRWWSWWPWPWPWLWSWWSSPSMHRYHHLDDDDEGGVREGWQTIRGGHDNTFCLTHHSHDDDDADDANSHHDKIPPWWELIDEMGFSHGIFPPLIIIMMTMNWRDWSTPINSNSWKYKMFLKANQHAKYSKHFKGACSFTMWGVKHLTGAQSQSHSIGQEKLRTIFVFKIAHLEGPHPAFAGHNSKFS